MPGSLAHVELAPTPNKIQRENSPRRLDVKAKVKGRDLGPVAGNVEDLLQKMKFPVGDHPGLLGEYRERQSAQRNLRTATILVALAIFWVRHASLRGWRLAAGGWRLAAGGWTA